MDLIDGFRAGDELTADLLDAMMRELKRWRHLSVVPPLGIDGAHGDAPPVLWNADPGPLFIQLTTTSDHTGQYGWQEVTFDSSGNVATTPLAGAIDSFPAREYSGLLGLPGDKSTIYRARFADDGQSVVFFLDHEVPAKTPSSIAPGSPANPTSASVLMYVPAPTDKNPAAMAVDPNAIATAWNEQPTTIPANAVLWLKPWHSRWYIGMYICCATSSSSSSSSTSDTCPTNACEHCTNPAACDVTVQIVGGLSGPTFTNPVCGGISGTFVVKHKSKCTWYFEDPATGLSATLYYDGTQWTLECIITGDTGSGVAVYRGAGYDCKTPQVFSFDELASTCICTNGGDCNASVTP